MYALYLVHHLQAAFALRPLPCVLHCNNGRKLIIWISSCCQCLSPFKFSGSKEVGISQVPEDETIILSALELVGYLFHVTGCNPHAFLSVSTSHFTFTPPLLVSRLGISIFATRASTHLVLTGCQEKSPVAAIVIAEAAENIPDTYCLYTHTEWCVDESSKGRIEMSVSDWHYARPAFVELV